MKATEARLLDFLKKSGQFIIPIYQRPYSWTQKQCAQLWSDIVRTGSSDNILGHFVGSIVYIEKGLFAVTSVPELLVIDGQQRLTTISLILAALAESLGSQDLFDGMNSRKLRNYYLLNPDENDDLHYKLLLSQNDRATLLSIVEGRRAPENPSVRVSENYQYFRSMIEGNPDQWATVYRGLTKLLVVDISLDRQLDNPQLIFESLNSTGLDLSQADLIRNYVLMGLEPAQQTRLYNEYWRPMEESFGQVEYVRTFDRFMRDYLTVKTGSIPNILSVYEEFKRYSSQGEAKNSVEALIADIRVMSGYFVNIALQREPDSEIRAAFQDINSLKVDVAYPFLLEIYDDFERQRISKQELLVALRLVESYVFRRAVCGIPTNSLNKTFLNLGREVNRESFVESLMVAFLLMPAYRRFPNDDEFKRELQAKDLYNFRSRNYWLTRIENYKRKELVRVGEYTIEHIMPQNPDLSKAWRDDLGPEWKEVQKQYLHTIGNLTLTGYNPEMSDKPFITKRDLEGGFKESPIRLNERLGHLQKWDLNEIRLRAARLAEKACLVWPAPKVSDVVMEQFRPEESSSTYSLADHPNLKGTLLEVFEQFRGEVLNLDSSVTEEFLKLYIAFKAPSNFVDVIPQSNRLRLSLNIDFAKLHDPKGLAKDVKGLGRWGNGDVDVYLSEKDAIPDVIYLVWQALEEELGGNAD